MPDYRGIQECYWKWALETAGGSAGARMLAPSATTIPAAPETFTSFGYSSMPNFSINNQPVPIYSLGSYRLFNSYKGIRDYSLRAEITLGNWQFLQYALRSSGLGTANGYKGLPVLCLALGSMNTYGTGFQCH